MHNAKCVSLKDFKTCWDQIMSFKCIKSWPWNAVEPITGKSKIFIAEIWGASKARNLSADIQDEIKSIFTKVTASQTWKARILASLPVNNIDSTFLVGMAFQKTWHHWLTVVATTCRSPIKVTQLQHFHLTSAEGFYPLKFAVWLTLCYSAELCFSACGGFAGFFSAAWLSFFCVCFFLGSLERGIFFLALVLT